MFVIREEPPIWDLPWRPATLTVAITAVFLGTWKFCTDQARFATGDARREIWAVPAQFDAQEVQQPGTVEELVYQTRAYATDGREVEKRTLVYHPWGYDGSRTDSNYFQNTIQSDEFRDCSINYLYVSSGNFDFALVGQIQDYQTLLELEPRLNVRLTELLGVDRVSYRLEPDMGHASDPLYSEKELGRLEVFLKDKLTDQ